MKQFTPYQQRILNLLYTSKTNAEIGVILRVKPHSVHNVLSHYIYPLTGTKNRIELMAKRIEELSGFISMSRIPKAERYEA